MIVRVVIGPSSPGCHTHDRVTAKHEDATQMQLEFGHCSWGESELGSPLPLGYQTLIPCPNPLCISHIPAHSRVPHALLQHAPLRANQTPPTKNQGDSNVTLIAIQQPFSILGGKTFVYIFHEV